MKRRNLNSPQSQDSFSQDQDKAGRPITRSAPWQNHARKVFTILMILSLILVSPLGVAPAHALDAPDLISPGDGSEWTEIEAPPLGVPEFVWVPVVGATLYRIQVCHTPSSNCDTAPIVNKTTPNTTYMPTSSSPFTDGDYFWRVRVEQPGPVSDWSTSWVFRKTWASTSNAPALVSPLNGATIEFYGPPSFSWTPVVGAAQYRLHIYTSPGGSAVSPITTLATTYHPTTKYENGLYYWHVIPLDTNGQSGTSSEEFSFTQDYAPDLQLLEPADDSEPTFTPTFKWTAVRGAQSYDLQYTTDPTFQNYLNNIPTSNSSYTPKQALQNDINYYWRVKVHSGNSVSEWSDSYTFVKKWIIKPVLLTPTNTYQHVRFPVYSWTPVPGAASYRVEISTDSGFASLFDSAEVTNTYYTPTKNDGTPHTYYWHVIPVDGSDNEGLMSDDSSFFMYGDSMAPQQVYPLHYYAPNTFPGFPGVTLSPSEDRTAPVPIFIWNRILDFSGQVYADAYRVQVATNPNFSSVVWSVDTENTSATPTVANPFTPLADTDYWWRVRPLSGGIGGSEIGEWSQRWRTRFDLAQGLAPTTGSTPTLIRPEDGYEFAEATPLLEWFPLSGATSYQVQISVEEDFSSLVDSATVPYPAYVPLQSLAQRSLGAVDFGVYYWRVSANGINWSAPQRFQISAQSQWAYERTVGSGSHTALQVGSDPAGEIGLSDPDYDLTNLHVTQDIDQWFFGFNVPNTPDTNVTYALYLDLDHASGSGANHDALGYSLTTIPAFQPEYAIYILQEAGAFSADKVIIYTWDALSGSDWEEQYHTLDEYASTGSSILHVGNRIEFNIPNTVIGHQADTGSFALSLVSLPAASYILPSDPTGSGVPQDSVPSDANVPGAGAISRFANVTERLNLVMPPNNAGIDPTTFPSIQPIFWDWPIGAPWSGTYIGAWLNENYTGDPSTYFNLTSSTEYYARVTHAWPTDMVGNNTYFLRAQLKYRNGTTLYNGVWSQGVRFERQGFVPENLQISVSFATPTFSWDKVEGAESYDIQVDDDPYFGGLDIPTTGTVMNSYTHTSTLPNGTYYWRVRAHRQGGIINAWTVPTSPCPANPDGLDGCFTLKLPTPTGLYHLPPGVVGRAPTLCWTPLIANDPFGDPVLAAWKYVVQVSKVPSFSPVFDSAETEQSCWTGMKGYSDQQYYWKVSIKDGNGRPGDFTDYVTVTKQYPITTLVSPLSGATITDTPTFVWTPVDGAAKYRLQTSIYENFGTTVEDVITDFTSYTPTGKYTISRTYYWRVAIRDQNGNYGPFSTAIVILDPYPLDFFLPFIKTIGIQQ